MFALHERSEHIGVPVAELLGKFEQESRRDRLSSTGRRNAVWPVTLKVRRDDWACLGDAAVVVEARPEGGPERR
jgi:hypothetical protein